MPRIADQFIESVVYLYPTKEDAERGAAFGGTGFLLAVRAETHDVVRESSSRSQSFGHVYAVTNQHVIGTNPVVRGVERSCETVVWDKSERDWVRHPSGDDLAACHLVFGNGRGPFAAVPYSDPDDARVEDGNTYIPSEKLFEKEGYGIGDRVFMVSRLIGRDGAQRNEPITRFGHLMHSHTVEIKSESGINQESWLVEMHSEPGHSGSPVYLHLPQLDARPGLRMLTRFQRTWLLGIDWGHLTTSGRILTGKERAMNTGVGCVVPSWKLRELIMEPELVQQRRQLEVAQQQGQTGGSPSNV